MRFRVLCLLFPFVLISCVSEEQENATLRLWYDEPAEEWTEALPLGNGRIGAMVYGGVSEEHIQFNEETLWSGKPRNYNREGAAEYLDEIRKLLFEGKQDEAEALAGEHFMGRMSNEDEYPAQLDAWMSEMRGDLTYADPGHDDQGWKTMTFPTKEGWESIGYPGLDGCIWLRFSFDLPDQWKGKDLTLNLGRIRDTDFTYFNGQFVNTETNKWSHRRYDVPANQVRIGDNIIAIQVLNFYNKGGLVGFKTGEPMTVYPKGGDIDNGVSLETEWKYFIKNKEVPESPHYQASYQPFGDIFLEFAEHKAFTNYERQLDLATAAARTTYQVDGVTFTREYFISEPDQVMMVRLYASEMGALNFNIKLHSLHQDQIVSQVDENTLRLDVSVTNGALKGSSFLRVKNKSGTLKTTNEGVEIVNADEVVLYMTAATNFKRFDDISGDPEKLALEDLNAIGEGSFELLKKKHVDDYQEYFNRFSIDLGSSEESAIPTDERIVNFAETNDPALVALYTQYGRYLMISTSRQGTRPPNLQGIWNDDLTPPWGGKYTTNINCEMNYWPAEPLNMSELHHPLFQMIEEVAERGKETARKHYGADGWVLHHNTDLWRGTAPINNANHGIWPTGGAWLCSHLWEHFQYTQDTAFLREKAWPIMKGAARFFVDFLIEDPQTGYLISTPSNSPENGGLVAAPAMDHQIIRDLFANSIKITEILGVDSDLRKDMQDMLPRIAPDQIGQYGQLQEWLADIDDPENTHRHVSHLWAVYPDDQISLETPELLEAAKQSLEFRGDDGTGWSLAWKINLWARFQDGNHAWKMIENLFRPAWGEDKRGGGSYKNLFDAHPPFQIDGNFGAAAGIAEMIVQSHGEKIVLLPALPDALPSGSVKGIKARGNFELDIEWQEGRLVEVKVQSLSGKLLNLEYQDNDISIKTTTGEVYVFDSELSQ